MALASKNVKIIEKCNACGIFLFKYRWPKATRKNHKISDDSNKPNKALDKDSAHNKISKFQTSLSKQAMKKAIRKDLDGKYECNKCAYKQLSQKVVRFHIMNKHEGVTWDCKFAV